MQLTQKSLFFNIFLRVGTSFQTIAGCAPGKSSSRNVTRWVS